MNWYFEREGVSAGPVEESDLILMIRRREVPRDSMIWHPGLDEWQPIAELKPEWLVVPGINSRNGTIAQEEPQPGPKAAPKPPTALVRAPAPSLEVPERAEPEEGAPPVSPRPPQVRTILPPKGKPQPLPRAMPAAPSPPPPIEKPPPMPEKKGFLKKLFGRGKDA